MQGSLSEETLRNILKEYAMPAMLYPADGLLWVISVHTKASIYQNN